MNRLLNISQLISEGYQVRDNFTVKEKIDLVRNFWFIQNSSKTKLNNIITTVLARTFKAVLTISMNTQSVTKTHRQPRHKMSDLQRQCL